MKKFLAPPAREIWIEDFDRARGVLSDLSVWIPEFEFSLYYAVTGIRVAGLWPIDLDSCVRTGPRVGVGNRTFRPSKRDEKGSLRDVTRTYGPRPATRVASGEWPRLD